MFEDILAGSGDLLLYGGWLLAIVMAFLLIFAKDMIKIKLALHFGKKKGVKLRIGIKKDHTVSIDTVTLTDQSKINDGKNKEVDWDAKASYFSRQFGVPACFTAEGGTKIIDPLGGGKIDMADGEVVDRMVKRAELMRDRGAGWMDTKEQKLLVIILIAVVITSLLTVWGQAQLGEFMTWARPAVAALQAVPAEVLL